MTIMRSLASLSTLLRLRHTGLPILPKTLLPKDLGLQRQRQVTHNLPKDTAMRFHITNRDSLTLRISRRPDGLPAHSITHFVTLLSKDLQALRQIIFITPVRLVPHHHHGKISMI
jgi:hypothetical protein